MITTEQKYARAMKLALDLGLDEPIDFEAATSRAPTVPEDGIDRVLDLLVPLLEKRIEFCDVSPLCGVSTCPTCEQEYKL